MILNVMLYLNCNEYYGKTHKHDGWVQYLGCPKWRHKSCTRLDDESLTSVGAMSVSMGNNFLRIYVMNGSAP